MLRQRLVLTACAMATTCMLIGCGGGGSKQVVTEFTAKHDFSVFSHDLVYTYTGTTKLEDVDLTITIWFDKMVEARH